MQLANFEHLAMLMVYSDLIHDILSEYDFNYELRRDFNVIDKTTKRITKRLFDGNDLGELDDWKIEIARLSEKLVEGNVLSSEFKK